MTPSRRLRAVLVVSALVLVAAGCDTWTHYRGGPTLAGVGTESTIGLANVSTLTETWRGNGTASSELDSPVVAAGKVFTTRAVYDVAGGSTCSASPRSCAPLWELPATSTLAPTTVAGNRQYRIARTNTEGTLSAFDAGGVEGCGGTPKVCQPVRTWSQIVPEIGDAVFGLTAPVVVGSTLYGGSIRSLIAADVTADVPCGGTPPRCPLSWAGSGLAPLNAVAVAGGKVYSVGNASAPTLPGRLHVLDAAGVQGCSGTPTLCQPLWTGDLGIPLGSQGAAFPPTVVDGVVYVVGSWRTAGSSLFAPDLRGGAVLEAFDAAGVQGCSGTPTLCQPLWTATLPGNPRLWSGMAVTGGHVFVPTESGVAVFDAKGVTGCSGTPTVCAPLATLDFGSSPGTKGAVTVANGVAYVGSMDGLFAFDAGLVQGCGGAPLVCQPVLHVLAGTSVTTPAVVDGRVHVLSNGQLVTLGLP